jgi:hypothetical protein
VVVIRAKMPYGTSTVQHSHMHYGASRFGSRPWQYSISRKFHDSDPSYRSTHSLLIVLIGW